MTMRKSDYGGRVRPSSPFKKRRKPTSYIYSKTRKFRPPPATLASNLTESGQEPLRDPCEARHDHAARYSTRSTNTWAVGRCLNRAIPLHLSRTSCVHVFHDLIYLLSPLFSVPLTPLHPPFPIATPPPPTRPHAPTIITAFSALGHTEQVSQVWNCMNLREPLKLSWKFLPRITQTDDLPFKARAQ